MKNETTGIDLWCYQGQWKTWNEMLPHEQVAKLAAKKAIKEATEKKEKICQSNSKTENGPRTSA